VISPTRLTGFQASPFSIAVSQHLLFSKYKQGGGGFPIPQKWYFLKNKCFALPKQAFYPSLVGVLKKDLVGENIFSQLLII